MRIGLLVGWMVALAACSSPKTAETAVDAPKPILYNDSEDGFTIIAHRGASGHAPENTLSAVAAAMKMRAEMVEVDVLLTADGVPVVLHDVNLKRTTGLDARVDAVTLAEVTALDAGSWFGESFSGEAVPTLEALLSYCSGKVALNLEIKPDAVTDSAEGGVVDKVAGLVRAHGMQKHVLISSFDPRAIRQTKEMAPDLAAAILYRPDFYEGLHPVDIARELDVDAFHCSWRLVRAGLVDSLHAAGIPVNVYTVNSDTLMHRMLDLGVDGIITDYPDMLLQVLRDRDGVE